MLAAVEARYCVDRDRVFVTGFSWGGDQTTALVCCRGDRIRAAAPASCTDEYGENDMYMTYDNWPCPAAGNTAIRFTHDWSGGDSGYPSPLFTTTNELYRAFNGCAATSSLITPAPCVAYEGCETPYVECPYMSLGHSLPGNFANETWAFFDSFR
jgi:polyhydroxybutyrate depolymerase